MSPAGCWSKAGARPVGIMNTHMGMCAVQPDKTLVLDDVAAFKLEKYAVGFEGSVNDTRETHSKSQAQVIVCQVN